MCITLVVMHIIKGRIALLLATAPQIAGQASQANISRPLMACFYNYVCNGKLFFEQEMGFYVCSHSAICSIICPVKSDFNNFQKRNFCYYYILYMVTKDLVPNAFENLTFMLFSEKNSYFKCEGHLN